jgi:hypothetical protein
VAGDAAANAESGDERVDGAEDHKRDRRLARRQELRHCVVIRGAASRFLLHPSPTIQIGPSLVTAKFTTRCEPSRVAGGPDRFEPIRFRPGS